MWAHFVLRNACTVYFLQEATMKRLKPRVLRAAVATLLAMTLMLIASAAAGADLLQQFLR